jgi:hypothetical protein
MRPLILLAVLAGCGSQAAADPVPMPPPLETAAPATVASRLARFLWDAEPDDGLLRTVSAAPISRDHVGRVAEQMLSDERARQGVTAFYRWWLRSSALAVVDKPDPEGILTPELRASLAAEAPALGVHLTLETAGTFADLLTAPFTFADERLARHYGMEGVAGTGMRKVAFPARQNRIGVLSGAGVLATFASLTSLSWPAKRGWLVTGPVLCSEIPSGFLPTFPLDPDRSIREQMMFVTRDSSCQVCHSILNSPGFAFIGFDSLGRWRPQPGHGPGETEGWITQKILPDEPHFDGPESLVRLLLSRKETRTCFVRRWLQFATARETVVLGKVSPTLQTSTEAAYADFEASGLSLRALIVAVTRTDAFLRP